MTRSSRQRAPGTSAQRAQRTQRHPPRGDALLGDLGALALFSRLVQTRSFTQAARAIGTSTSAASKRIATLERRLGVRLIERTTRRTVPTEAGLVLYERSQRLLAEAALAEEALVSYRGGLAGRLRVSAPVTFGFMHVAPLVARFVDEHPELRVSLSLNDRSVDLLAEGVDVAIRAGRTADSSLTSRKLANDQRVLCATPTYLARHGTPRSPAELLEHRCLRHPLMGPPGGWQFTTPEGPLTLPVTGPLEIDHVGALRDAVLASIGLAVLPAYAVAADLRAGRLVSVLSAFLPASPPFRALWVSGKVPSRRVAAFVDFVAEELPKRL